MVMTRYDAPWKNMKEFVNYAKENPNKLKWSHQARGNRDWMVGTLIFQKAGIKLLDVPTAGSNEAMAALLGNNIDASLTSFGPMIIAQMEAKKIQVLGFLIQSSNHNSTSLPSKSSDMTCICRTITSVRLCRGESPQR